MAQPDRPALSLLSGRSSTKRTISAALAGGSDADDTLFGSTTSDTLQGFGGNDTLYGDAGNDTLEGGAGADSHYGGGGIDFVSFANASSGVGVNLGFAGGDGSSGFAGEAVGDAYDSIEGIIGSPFDDVLIGQTGASDTIYGGAGNDVLSGQGGTGADSLYGGAGLDSVSYADQTVGLSISLLGTVGAGGSAAGDRLYEIEDLTGGSGGDTITGSLVAETLHGSAGNDTLNGGLGTDTLDGGPGADTLYGGSTENGDVVTYANSGAGVTIFAGAGSGGDAAGDVLSRIEIYVGSAHGDSLAGVLGVNETFYGGGGDDVLIGYSATDPTDSGADAYYGGEGLDSVNYSSAAGGVTASLATGRGTGGAAAQDIYFSIERLIGALGNDTLSGSAAADTLEGFDGNDTLQGGAGGDTLIGGAGIDTVSWASSASAVTFAGTTGSAGDAAGDVVDQVEAYIGSAHHDSIVGRAFISDTVYGGAGDDFIGGSGVPGDPGDQSGDTLYGGTGIDSVGFFGGTGSITIDLTQGRGWGSNAENDYFHEIESILGSLYNDTLIGSANADTLDGFDSNDTLVGNAGIDTLIGGAGDDTLIGGAGGDRMSGGVGLDAVSWATAAGGVTWDGSGAFASSGEAMGDLIDPSIEIFIGSSHSDLIFGRGGISETLYGGGGDDQLAGGGAGGTPGMGGNDAFGDSFFGGAGYDSVKYNGGSAAVTIDLSVRQGFGGNAENDWFFGIEHVIGSFEQDTLIGSAAGDTLDGDLANDTLVGLGGDDLIFGNAGDDIVLAGTGADTLYGGAGADTASYATAGAQVTAFLNGTVGIGDYAAGDRIFETENLIGSNFDDRLDGSSVANGLFGGSGDDLLNGLGGEDLLYGGDGHDILFGDGGADTLYGGTGNDTASYLNGAARGVQVLLMARLGFNDIAEGDRLYEIENLVGTNFDDTLSGSIGDNLVDGAVGHDTLFGEAGNDTLLGGDGDDRLDDTAGADSIFGGNGDDTVQYSAASYQLSGGAGIDTLLGSAGADTIDLGVARFSGAGGGGTATANTNAGGFDVLELGEGDDLVYFTTVSANDLSLTVFGGAGNDRLSMLDGDAALGSSHTLYGGDGADRIWAGWFGMGGSATVFGGVGDDFIYAGGGAAGPGGYDDTLYGGEGFDVYYWSPNSGGFGRDILHDGSAGGNGLVIFSGNTAPAGGFPDTGAVDNDPAGGRVVLVEVGDGWFEIQDKDDPSSAIRFRGGDITVINLQSRPGGGVPGENFVYAWDWVNGVWIDQNG